MYRKISSLTVIIFFIFFIIFLITSNKVVLESVSFSISVWKDNLFPTLFPFLVVANILIQYGCVEILSRVFNNLFQKIYHLPGTGVFVLIASLFSGFPSGSKYTTLLVKENKLTNDEATKLLTFTHYSNPLFILGFINSIIFNKKITYIILVSHILAGLIIGKMFCTSQKKRYPQVKRPVFKRNQFGKVLASSINDSLNTMFLLLGIITVFTLITAFFTNAFNLNIYLKSILAGFLEITQGIKYVSLLNISDYYKMLLITLFISFGGLSIHMQVLSIISETKIKYKPFFIARILHGIIACGLVSIFYYFIN